MLCGIHSIHPEDFEQISLKELYLVAILGGFVPSLHLGGGVEHFEGITRQKHHICRKPDSMFLFRK